MLTQPHILYRKLDAALVSDVAEVILNANDFSICDRLAAQYRDMLDVRPHAPVKYVIDYPRHVRDCVRRALALGLNECTGLDILDLATGAGFFPLVCRHFGHHCVALDLPDDPVYGRVTKHFGIEVVAARIEGGKLLPDFGLRFDAVTAFAIAFSRRGDMMPWASGDWRFLLDDLRRNHLKPEGLIWLVLNKHFPGDAHYDDDVKSFFLSQGGAIKGGSVVFRLVAG